MKQPLLDELRDKKVATLVLFTSGTTGEPKGIVHDFTKLLEKYKTRRPAYRTLAFLPLDHMGGINTMLHTLYNGGCLIVPQKRDPEYICKLIQDYEIELLPTTPTFLKLLIASRCYEKYNLSSLEIISYGTEAMPQVILDKLNEIFPEVKLLQTYGMSELGVLRSKSKDNNSLWVKIGGEGFETRVVDGMLEIKADTAMVGYINAPSPFTEDGWIKTGDRVEVEGEYYKILGRESEVINVGGNKVYPQEVEEVILQMYNVIDCTVYGLPNYLMGQIVCADITWHHPRYNFIYEVKSHCKKHLDHYKIPIKISLVDQTENFKKKRK